MTDQPDPTPEELQELLRRLTSGNLSPDDLARLQEEIRSNTGMSLPPEMLQQALAQFTSMMSGPDEGPVQWSLAEDTARKVAAYGEAGLLKQAMQQMPEGFEFPQMPQTPFGNPFDPSAGFGGTAGGSRGPIGFTPNPTDADLDLPAEEETGPGPDQPVDERARRESIEALRLASMWLDPVTSIPAASVDERAWSRLEWVDATLATWRPLCEPVAEQVATMLTQAMSSQLPPEVQAMAGQAAGMMRKMGGAVFGAQVGRAIGGLSAEVVSAHDIGLPLVPAGTSALLPANVAAFGAGLEVPADEVRLYLALREAAYTRLFGHAAWLRAGVLSAVTEFARGITIDMDAMTEAVRSIDPTDAEGLQQAMSSGIFEPKRSEAQQAALTRLETTLALVEGWVDEVTNAAAVGQLPNAARLREAVRRRRATGGPAEHTLATLVGLELRPRRLREAAALWAALAQKHGNQARDEVWSHPDLTPTTDDLDDPLGYVERFGRPDEAAEDMDEALRKLLDGE